MDTMNDEMPKRYTPSEVEDDIYAQWTQSGYFNPDNLEGEPFTIMMPPPNVTGVLHLGHALENTLMDLMARYQRMRGKKVLLLPGTDHAAVPTQAKVEKLLMKEGIKFPRKELGREKLVERIRVFADDSRATILSQIKKMGTSCDWSRLAYTFDESRNRAVNELFARMYNDGLIYRGYRVVNWSVKGQCTCSDDELEYIDRTTKLYTFKYSEDFPFTIATTRPETKLGDTAVAVNPKDERYAEYIGKTYDVDFCGNALQLNIIADDQVDPEFGTGALGVTPAHSSIDFAMYEKQKAVGNDIGIIPVIGSDGKMTVEAGKEFVGLTAEDAREKVVDLLRKQGLLVSEEETEQNVGTSDRFGDVVEAIPMTQWWLDVQKVIPGRKMSLRDLMREALTTGLGGDEKQKIAIHPERFTKLYLDRVEHLRDWCLSRQIWWGHRIPVWYRGEETVVGEKPEGEGWEQDEDTLDTWFSSGSWTFSTLGWPDDSLDLKSFHPTNWMQMGYEIIFLWLMRMVLMSAYALDEIPFRNVYIHGMLRDKDGQKFSKSMGNGIDPIDVISKYGVDALRFSLIAGITPGNDSRFYEEKVESGQKLINKIWNISRFAFMNVENVKSVKDVKPETLDDKWILSEFSTLVAEVTEHFEKYQYSMLGEKLREFTWSKFADVYLENAKFQKNENTESILLYILDRLMRLWHPLIPFVTEEIYKKFEGGMLMIQSWPQASGIKMTADEARQFALKQSIIERVRLVRAEKNLPWREQISIDLYGSGAIQDQDEVLKQRLKLDEINWIAGEVPQIEIAEEKYDL